MELTGERRIAAPRERVWEALNDAEVLRASIPGCESVDRTAEDEFQAKVAVKLGPMSARFGGKVKLTNINAPESYTISGEGQGGPMGFAKGGADVALEAVGPQETVLRYNVKAQIGGKMAQLGARLIDSTAKSMAEQFFDRFAAQVVPPVAAVPGTDTEYLAHPGAPAPITHHGADGMSPGGVVQRPGPHPGSHPWETALPMRLMTSQFLGFPFQVWFGAAAMLVILLLLFT